MANLNFKEDLKLGNEGEKIVKEFLIQNGATFINFNNDNKYDIKMRIGNKFTTYEVKTDVKCAPLFDTGNIFIEYESRGKKSGIEVTEADWFVTYFRYLQEIWFIRTDKLKELIENNIFKTYKDAGDTNSATHGYLIKRKDFKNFFYVAKLHNE